MFLPHTVAKRDAPKQGIPLHIIFELFYQNTSFSVPQALFAPVHWHRISEFQAQGIVRKNQ